MPNDISYNQLIIFQESSIKCQILKGSHVSEGKLMLILENYKIDIDGKNIEVTGQKKRIQEIIALAEEKGFYFPDKSIKHYARGKDGVEYVLVKW